MYCNNKEGYQTIIFSLRLHERLMPKVVELLGLLGVDEEAFAFEYMGAGCLKKS